VAGFTLTQTIDRPVDEVFDFVADPDNAFQYQEGLLAVRMLSDGPLDVGSRWRQSRLVDRMIHSREIEVVALNRPFDNRFQPCEYAGRSRKGGIETVYRYRFLPLGPDRTRIELTATVTARSPLFARYAELAAGVMKQVDRDHLDRLKRALEAPASASA